LVSGRQEVDPNSDAAALRESLAASRQERRALQRLERSELQARQLARLNALLARVLPHNAFYAAKLAGITPPLDALDALQAWPFTTKDELAPAEAEADQPFARNVTYALDQYLRFHQTSGTKGRPLVVPDDADGWQDWMDGWQFVLDAAELVPGERALLAFSFGPFVGFWSAFDAVVARGCMAIPAGGMNTEARLDLLRRSGAAAVFCTPSYALHMAETAQRLGVDLAAMPVRILIVAGEPGGSIPSTRAKIETAWNARLIDHAGATEVGPWGFADAQGRGLHVNESQFIAEFLSIQTGQPAGEGELAELVLTNLGRPGTPILRYRTGDLVRPVWKHGQECRFVLLDGGVLGRADEMLIIRGVNIYPSAIEQIVRGFPEIAEYRLTASREGQMDQLQIEIEDAQHDPQRVAREVQVRLGLRVTVVDVPPGTLSRFEGKGRRFVDKR
jgi:phenylacetate-CoA ligase